MATTHLMYTPLMDGREPCRSILLSMYWKTAMNKAEHGVCLLDFVRKVFGKMEVVLESNTKIFFWR